jgi:1,2-diacylglycerol 3-alpha-glucosyltransferase
VEETGLRKKLTICMVTNNYTPYSGGVVSSIQALTHELRKQGHRVVIVTLDFTGAPEGEPDVERLRCIARFRYKKNPLAVPFNVKSQLQAIFKRYMPDIIHVHHPFLLGPIAVGLAREYFLPVAFTHHSLYEHYAHYVPLPRPVTCAIARAMLSSFCSTVDCVIAPTNSIKEYLVAQGVTNQIEVVSSGVLPLFTSRTFEPKPALGDRIVQLLTVSRFVREKNIVWLLEMFARLNAQAPGQFCLKLVGYGPEYSFLKNYAYGRLSLSSDHVVFIEKPSKQDLATIYQHADIFVFASQSETQGLVLAEAFSQGTPAVALKGPGVIDIIHDAYNGFLVESQQEMVSAIKTIRGNQALFNNLQRQAYQTALLYDPTYTSAQMLNVYDHLILDQKSSG